MFHTANSYNTSAREWQQDTALSMSDCITKCTAYTMSTKSMPNAFFTTILKLFTNFQQMRHVATAINAKQHALKLSTSPAACTYTTL